MNRSEKPFRSYVLSILVSAGVAVASSVALTLVLSVPILFSEEPSVFFIPAGLFSLYAGAAAGGTTAALKTEDGVLSGLLCGVILTAVTAAAGLFAGAATAPRPVPLTLLLFASIPAASAAGALVASKVKGKRKRPSLKRRSYAASKRIRGRS